MIPSPSSTINWQTLYDITLRIGFAPDPKTFTIRIAEEINRILPYDQCMILYFDGNGHVNDKYTININENWVTMYLEYYAKVVDGQYSHTRGMQETSSIADILSPRDWTKEPMNEFIRDYIRPRGLKHSLGFPLFDTKGLKRVLFAFDRTTDTPFSEAEKMNLFYLKPILSNQFKSYLYQPQKKAIKETPTWSGTDLTAREIEVAELLCQGISPANISRILHISKATSYKHIAHIYEKMNVSSRQELLVKLLQ